MNVPHYPQLNALRWLPFAVPAGLFAAFPLIVHLMLGTGTAPSLLFMEVGAMGAGIFIFFRLVLRHLTRLEAELLEKNAQLEALNEAAMNISSHLALHEVLQQVVERSRQVVRARYAALRVLPADGEPAHYLTAGLSEAEKARVRPDGRGPGVMGFVQETGHTVRLRDVRQHPASVGFPPGHPVIRSFMAVPIRSGDRVVGLIYVANKEGASEFTAADEEAVTRLANQAAVAIQNARLYEREERARRYLERLLETSRDAIVVVAGDGTVRFWNSGAEFLYGLSREEALGQRLPMVPEADRQKTLDQLKAVLGGDFARSAEAVHLRRDGSPIPVLVTASPVPAEPDDAELRVLLTVKDLSAQKRLEAQRRRLALLEERARIGMDLHDGCIQSLYAIGLTLEATVHVLPPDLTGARGRLEQVTGQLNGVIQELRRYILDEPHPTLMVRSVTAALADAARRLEEHGLAVTLRVHPEVADRVPVEVASQLMPILGEAISNVVRHSQARRVKLELRPEGEEVVLTVQDDGLGFDPGMVSGPGHMGLRNMRARAEVLGGCCCVRSAPGEGTEVEVRVPLEVGVVSRV